MRFSKKFITHGIVDGLIIAGSLSAVTNSKGGEGVLALFVLVPMGFLMTFLGFPLMLMLIEFLIRTAFAKSQMVMGKIRGIAAAAGAIFFMSSGFWLLVEEWRGAKLALVEPPTFSDWYRASEGLIFIILAVIGTWVWFALSLAGEDEKLPA